MTELRGHNITHKRFYTRIYPLVYNLYSVKYLELLLCHANFTRRISLIALRLEIIVACAYAEKNRGRHEMVSKAAEDGLVGRREKYARRPQFIEVSSTERIVLGHVLRGSARTQAAVTRAMPVSQQTVSRLVTGLVEQGLLAATDRVSEGRRGQPTISLELVPDALYCAGFTVMADTMSFALLDFAGNVHIDEQYKMSSMQPATVLDTCREVFAKHVHNLRIDNNNVFGIGVAVTGYFVTGKPGFNTPPSLPEWAFVDVEKAFSDAFDLPVWAENDGNAAAIGESMIGVGRWARDFAYLYVSSGLGGGVVMDGELMRGDLGNAGEFSGILPYNVYPHPTLELLRQLCCRDGIHVDSIYDLVTQFDPQWPCVDEWVHKTQGAYSLIASATSAVLDCTAIVLGGRMPKQLAEKLIPAIEFYSAPRRSFARPTPKIVPAEAVGEVTAIGAATLPLRAMYFR